MAVAITNIATEELDKRILQSLYDHRLLTTKQLTAIVGMDLMRKNLIRVKRRLEAFEEKKLVKTRRITNLGVVGYPSNAYFLSDLGIERTMEFLGIPFNRYQGDNKIVEKNHYTSKDLLVSSSQLSHHFYTQTWIMETILSIRQTYGDELLNQLQFIEPRREPYRLQNALLTHRPDWLVKIERANLVINLEMDMGTMNSKKIHSKFLRYAEWLEANPTDEKHIILFTTPYDVNITRSRSLKKLAFDVLGPFIEQGRADIIIGSTEVTKNWLLTHLASTFASDPRDHFTDSLKHQASLHSCEVVAFDYHDAIEVFSSSSSFNGYFPPFDKMYIISSPSGDKVIFKIQKDTGECSSEANSYAVSNFISSLVGFKAFVYLVYANENHRTTDIPMNKWDENVYATDLEYSRNKGFRYAWKWLEGKGWRRVEVSLFA